MFRGRVKRFFDARGFGFIMPDPGQELPARDVFVHISSVRHAKLDFLQAGDAVQFNVVAGRDGRQEARDIRLIDEPAPVRYGAA